MDMARKKGLKLFVAFVDFTTAYDRVPHTVLCNRLLKRPSCGAIMLNYPPYGCDWYDW